MTNDGRPRCDWPGDDELMRCYHDEEWGVPVRDDRKWFEYLVLDAFQAGLSWRTVLHRREGFRKVFCDFAPGRVARLTQEQIGAACVNPAIIRNRLKIEATVRNARVFLDVQERHGSFDAFIWSFTDGEVIHNRQPVDEAGGLFLRRQHHLLCLPAGRRHRQRPPGALLPVPGVNEARRQLTQLINMTGIDSKGYSSPSMDPVILTRHPPGKTLHPGSLGIAGTASRSASA